MRSGRLLGLVGCAIALAGLTGAGLDFQRQDNIAAFVAVALVQGLVYLLALGLVRRLPGSRALVPLILGVALLLRFAVLLAPPYLSTDIYRYIWDGRVIAAGINPYRYIPTDPHLAALQDADIFPNINRNNYALTIYPPVAEAIFFAVTRIGESLFAMKAAMVGLEAIAVALLLALLTVSRRPASRIIVYAWHPLPLWEFAGSGHIDAAIIALVAAALWLRRRPAFAGLALAGGALVKFYPAMLLPALWRRGDWRMPAAFVALALLAYLPVLGVGWRVLGFLPRYVAEEGFTAGGSGFYLWNILRWAPPLSGLPNAAYIAAAGGLLIALAARVALRAGRPDPDIRGAGLVAGAVMLLLSPHYAWYFAWLIIFASLVPSAALVWLTLASFLLYLLPLWPQVTWTPRRFLIESVLYLPFLALAVAEWLRQRRRETRHAQRPAG
jgi:alpha-1,6-mannosyltransferase